MEKIELVNKTLRKEKGKNGYRWNEKYCNIKGFAF